MLFILYFQITIKGSFELVVDKIDFDRIKFGKINFNRNEFNRFLFMLDIII